MTDYDDFEIDIGNDCASGEAEANWAPSSPRVTKCRCNSGWPCDTFRNCNSQRKPIVKYDTEEGDDLVSARTMIRDAYMYRNLENQHSAPKETANTVVTLAMLRAACVHDLSPYATEQEAELFCRVHAALDWDERCALIEQLDALERFDSDERHLDCFTCSSQVYKQRTELHRWLYNLCCYDDTFCADPQRFALDCLCNLDGICLNPQHYVHRKKRRCVKRCRKRCADRTMRDENPLVEDFQDEDDDDVDDNIDEHHEPASSINVLSLDEVCMIEEEAERQRQFAIAACIDDQFRLDERWREVQAELLREDEKVAAAAAAAHSDDDNTFLSFADIMQADDAEEATVIASAGTGNVTPKMQTYTNACATPVETINGSPAATRLKPLVIPNLPILGARKHIVRKPLPNACKTTASIFEAAMTAWHYPSIVS